MPDKDPLPSRLVWQSTALTFIAAAIAAYTSGLIVFMGDSYLLADRAKHLAQAGNLDLNNSLGGLIYPPLYAILISPAYLTLSPATSFRIILLIQALLVACQVWPYYKLLVQYSRLTPRQAAWVACALSLAPATLPYAYMVQTEVLYFPLWLWTTYFLLQSHERGKRRDFGGFGVGLGLMLLTRSAASTVLVATAIVFAFELWLARRDWKAIRVKLSGFWWVAIGVLATYGPWKLYEQLFVHYQGFQPYFTLAQIKPIFTQREVFDIHFAWLSNAAFYYLMSPLSIAGCFLCVLCFRRYRTLLKDPLAPFALAALAVSAVTVVIVMDTHYGGRQLLWNKYLMPYVGFVSLIALRYRRLLTVSAVNICGIILAITFLALKPSDLGCHFEDALFLFAAHSNPMHLPEAVGNGLFALALFVPAWLWVKRDIRAKTAAAVIVAGFWLAAAVGPVWFYRHSGDLNISNYDGAAKRALAFAQAHPGTQTYYDPQITQKDAFIGMRTLFYWPRILEPRVPSELSASLAKGVQNIIYFSAQELANLTPIAQDRGAVNAYVLDVRQSSSAPALAGMTVGFDRSVWGQEVAVLSGREYKVRWLQQNTGIQINDAGPERDVLVQLDLSTLAKPHTARLKVNGAMAAETPSIRRVFWVQGSETASYRVHLRSGTNDVQLESVEPPEALPGGRLVCFLLIGNVRVVPVTP